MNLPNISIEPEPFRCLIIGVGGCGCTILDKMIAAEYGRNAKYGEVKYIAVESDSDTLTACEAEQQILIPKAALHKANQELQEQLAAIPSVDMVFVISGMGGGTGTNVSPIIAEYAKQHDALTIGVVTLPLPAEGEQRGATAEKGLSALRQSANSVVVVPLVELASALPVSKVEGIYHEADKAITTGIMSLVDAVIRHGLIGLDFADLMAILGEGGISRIGYGSTIGNNRARQAVDQAICNPMLGTDNLENSTGVIAIITGGNDISIDEVAEIADVIAKKSKEDTQVIFQAFYDGKEGELSLIVVACAERAKARQGFP